MKDLLCVLTNTNLRRLIITHITTAPRRPRVSRKSLAENVGLSLQRGNRTHPQLCIYKSVPWFLLAATRCGRVRRPFPLQLPPTINKHVALKVSCWVRI